MPSLPEFGNIFRYKGVVEVLVEMEAENSSETYRHIGIARKIEINVKGVENYPVPGTYNGKLGYISAEEFIYDFVD